MHYYTIQRRLVTANGGRYFVSMLQKKNQHAVGSSGKRLGHLK